MLRPTLSDVARHAGVSYSTADRVVNRRGNVAAKSAAKVLTAIEELGYARNVAAANLSQKRVYRFGFVIPVGHNSFFRKVRAILEREREALLARRTAIEIVDVAAFDPQALVAVADRLADQALDGVAIVGIEGEGVASAMDNLRKAGIAVVTLVSDLDQPARAAYVGIDNVSAGRTGARLMGLAHGTGAGLVQPIVGALSARDHRDRLTGFCEVMKARFPLIEVLPEIEGRDRHELVDRLVKEAFAAHPDITGIYSLGAGNSGLARRLRQRPAAAPRPTVIVHELGNDTRQALEDGVFDIVIDQRPEEEIARALTLMRDLSDRVPIAETAPIIPAIIVKENLPTREAPLPLGAFDTGSYASATSPGKPPTTLEPAATGRELGSRS
jgi:LacI family transcriptional regulator, galactose operon repressor